MFNLYLGCLRGKNSRATMERASSFKLRRNCGYLGLNAPRGG